MKPPQSSGGASVELVDIHKSYGRHEVLRGIDIDIPPGSFTTFLGPSGSGKTTTLAITTGLVAPSSGRVLIDGRDSTHVSVDKRDLGFVFQSYALFPHMTVEKNVAYPLRLRGVESGERRRRVAEALELVRLNGFEKRYPSQLSGGQQQRVALARAVVFRPRVLLMDEPLGALDAGLRGHLQREIVRIGRELGVTIMYVTHDQDEALSMSEQVVLFHDGLIVQAGTPRDLYAQPRTAFAARFVGAGSLAEGVLDGGPGVPAVRVGADVIPVDCSSLVAAGAHRGDRVAAVLRPEHLLVTAAAAHADGMVPLGRGRVADVIYTGSQLRLRITVSPTLEVEHRCDASGAPPWGRGDEVSVSLRADRLPTVVLLDDAPPDAGGPTDTATGCDARGPGAHGPVAEPQDHADLDAPAWIT